MPKSVHQRGSQVQKQVLQTLPSEKDDKAAAQIRGVFFGNFAGKLAPDNCDRA